MFLELLDAQKDFFNTGKTKEVKFLVEKLKALKKEILNKENDICDAIYKDFKKSKFETYVTEISVVLKEIDFMLKHIKSHSKPKRVAPALLNFPSTEFIYNEPYGNTLIISPWNYPFQLALAPLINALACGNTIVLKPSELTPNTATEVNKIISSVFKPEHVKVIEGAIETSTALLHLKWDYIFFTGSVKVGKIVAQAAAKNLTPVTLELGGKNPCIIDKTSDIKLTAKRIVWGKFLNAGQTCIAPDYILIHESVKTKFYEALKLEITVAYGENPELSNDYTRIVNKNNFNRLEDFLEGENIIIGGKTNSKDNYIAPTVLNEPHLESKVMKDEIFGPILPVISYTNFSDLKTIINRYAKPLALYTFSNDSNFKKKVLNTFSFGGGVINDTIIQFTNHNLPFGGVGESGIGAYHGKYSFKTFSHQKSIVKKGNWLDLPFRYAPYNGKLKTLKKLLKWL